MPSSVVQGAVGGAPPAPEPISPAYGSVITPDEFPPVGIPEVEWGAVEGAASYRVQFSNDIGFSSTPINITTPNTTYTPVSLGPFIEGVWYWRVRVESSPGGASEYSNPMEFTKQWATTTNKPVLETPADFETISFYDYPIFTWTPVIGAARYRFQIDDNPDFTSITYSADTLATTHQPALKLDNATYYWRVIPLDAADRQGMVSDSRQFTLFYAEIPTLIEPLDGSFPVFTPTFRWEAVRGAEKYLLQYSTDPSFNTGVTQIETRNTTYTPTGTIPNDVNYYWRVKAISGNSDSDWSVVYSFLKRWYIQPILLSPPNNYLYQYMPPLFNWSPVPGAAEYKIEIDDTPDFASPIYNHEVINAFYTPIGVAWSNLPVYYWRVTPLDSDGRLGKASEVFSFQTSVSYAPELVYPFAYYDPTVEDPNNPGQDLPFSPVEDRSIAYPLFVWHRSVDFVDGVYASAYRVQVDDNPNFTSVDWEYDTETLNAVPTSTEPFTPVDGTLYYWRVAALSGIGGTFTSEWSHRRAVRFEADLGLPPLQTGAQTLLRPINGEELVEYTPRFDWWPYEGATSYQIQISRDEAFTDLVETATVPYPSYAPQEALAERHFARNEFGTFYWRVRPMDGGNPIVDWSAPWRFQIAATSQWIRADGLGRAADFQIGSDPLDQGDSNYELTGLYATQSLNHWYFAIDATTAATNMTYAFYLDQDYQTDSGGDYDPCGYDVSAISSHRPEYILYVYQLGAGFLASNTAIYSWNPDINDWNVLVQSLADVGGGLAYDGNILEVQIPNTAIGFNEDEGSYNLAVLSFMGAEVDCSPPAGTPPVDVVPDISGATGNLIERFSAVSDRPQLVFPFNNLGGDPTTYPSVLPFAIEYPAGFDPSVLTPQPSFPSEGPSFIETMMPELRERLMNYLLDSLQAGSPWSGGASEIYLDPEYTTIVGSGSLVCNCQYYNWQSYVGTNTSSDLQGDNSYYWRFRSRYYTPPNPPFPHYFDLSPWSEGYRFEREGFVPENLQISVDFATPTFSWNWVEGADTYTLQVDNDPTFGSPSINIITAQNTYTPPSTLDNGTYYWRVRMIREGNITNDWSPTETFTLSLPIPENLRHYPTTKNGVVGRAPTFCWDFLLARDANNVPVLAAWKYRLQFSLDATFSSGTTTVDTEQTCHTPTSGYADGTYYWHVAMIDGNNRLGEYSATQQVTKQYPITELIAPLNGENLLSTPTFVWTAVDGAASYRLEVSTTPTFASLYDTIVTNNVRYTPTKTYADATYYWRVAIIDRDNKQGPFNDAVIILGDLHNIYLPIVTR